MASEQEARPAQNACLKASVADLCTDFLTILPTMAGAQIQKVAKRSHCRASLLSSAYHPIEQLPALAI